MAQGQPTQPGGPLGVPGGDTWAAPGGARSIEPLTLDLSSGRGPHGQREPSRHGRAQAALTMGGRAWGRRTLARLRAAGSLRTGRPPPTRSWPGPDSRRSPSAALGGKSGAGPPPCREQTVLQVSPAPGLTCPTAHRAGPPHGGPCPGLWPLRLEVGEGDVWACKVTILLPVAPVNLPGTDGELGLVRWAPQRSSAGPGALSKDSPRVGPGWRAEPRRPQGSSPCLHKSSSSHTAPSPVSMGIFGPAQQVLTQWLGAAPESVFYTHTA